MTKLTNFILIAFTAIFVVNCSDDNSKQLLNEPNVDLYTRILGELSADVITNTYFDLNESAIAFKSSIDLLSIGNQTALNNAKTAWRETRVFWEQSQAFNYGPAVTAGIGPALDSWPIDREVLDTIVATDTIITPEVIALNPKTRGFHLFELLLWGENGNKTAEQLTPKEIEILKAAAQDFQNNTQLLYDGWQIDGDNYGASLINAGQSGSTYVSQTSALEDIVNGMITLANEVSETKIGNPYSIQIDGGNGSLVEESAISNNSKADFQNNIKSIQNIYLGEYNSISSGGIEDIVLTKDETLDADIKVAINEATDAVNAIPGTFSEALVNDPDAVKNAMDKIADLKTLLESRLLPFISNN